MTAQEKAAVRPNCRGLSARSKQPRRALNEITRALSLEASIRSEHQAVLERSSGSSRDAPWKGLWLVRRRAQLQAA